MFLYSLFPPPKYLSLPSVGMDISDRSLKYVSFSRARDGIRLEKYGNIAMPNGLIESGVIRKKKELAAFLEAERRSLGVEYAAISLPEEKAFLYMMQLPLMENDRMRETIELQLEEHVPLPPREIIFDYEVIPSAKPDHIDVSVAAYPKNFIEEYRDALQGAGITPVIFEIEAQSIARAVVPGGSRETILIIDFGKTRTSFFIVSGGQLRFTSTINVAGEDIDKAISKNLKVDMVKAENIKKEQGNIFTASSESNVYASVMPTVSAIKNEAEKSLEFWETHAEHIHEDSPAKIDRIILCGGDANLYGLPEYLSRSLNIKAGLANVWCNVASLEDYVPEIAFRQSLGYATAIGLGLKVLDI